MHKLKDIAFGLILILIGIALLYIYKEASYFLITAGIAMLIFNSYVSKLDKQNTKKINNIRSERARIILRRSRI